MIATNHALTGALIVCAVGNPLIALPLAFASHFLLDSLPHYGENIDRLSGFTKLVWLIDAVLLSSLAVYLLVGGHWLLMAGAAVAMSPDVAWVYRFVVKEKFGRLKPAKLNAFNSFHSRIQRYEFRAGISIEAVYLVLASALLFFARA